MSAEAEHQTHDISAGSIAPGSKYVSTSSLHVGDGKSLLCVFVDDLVYKT